MEHETKATKTNFYFITFLFGWLSSEWKRKNTICIGWELWKKNFRSLRTQRASFPKDSHTLDM
jgi:hypothetical protein